jgi:hypothetical protein
LSGVEGRVVFNSGGIQRAKRRLANLLSVFQEPIGVGSPIRLDPTGKMCDRIRLDADARYTELLALNERGPCSAKRVQYLLLARYAEALYVVADEMRRE